MISDGALESELLVQSFTITDTRTTEKIKYRKIMSLINTDVKQQFMASVSISGGEERTSLHFSLWTVLESSSRSTICLL